MITSNQDYGIQIEQLKNSALIRELGTDCGDIKKMEQDEQGCDSNLSFLYTRESDRIGAEIRTSRSFLAKAFDKEKLKQGRAKLENFSPMNESRSSIISAEEMKSTLDNYNHVPKIENPLYTTTANEFGSKKPSQATLTKMRYMRSQSFSKSFNRIMFQDQGLNTSLSRSSVHDRLDSHLV